MKRYKKNQRNLQQEVSSGGPQYPLLAPFQGNVKESEALENDFENDFPTGGNPKQPMPSKVIEDFSDGRAEAPTSHAADEPMFCQTLSEDMSTGQIARAPAEDDLTRGNAEAYCLYCGAPQTAAKITKKLEEDEQGLVSRRAMWGNPFQPKPLQILGAGRVDPFISHPREATNQSTHELMDHGKRD